MLKHENSIGRSRIPDYDALGESAEIAFGLEMHHRLRNTRLVGSIAPDAP